VSEETVKVGLGDDYYQGAYYSTTDSLLEYEVPRSTLERWEAAQAAYGAMQDEIEKVMRDQAARIRAQRPALSPGRMTSIIQDIYGPAILAQLAQPITIRIPKEPE
jgi:hypothetical protein